MVIATYGVAIYIYIIGWVEMGSAGWAMVSGWFMEKTWKGWANIMIRCLWQNHFTYWGRHTWNAQESVSCQGCVWSKLIRPLSDHSQGLVWQLLSDFHSVFWVKMVLNSEILCQLRLCLGEICEFYEPNPFHLDPQKFAEKSRETNWICAHHAALQPLKVLYFTCSLYSWHVWIPPLTSACIAYAAW